MIRLIALSIIFTSCSSIREKYNTSGFNSQKMESVQELRTSHKIDPFKPVAHTPPNEVLACENWIPSRISSMPVEAILPTKHLRKSLFKAHLNTPGDCDEILLFGGERMKAKILEINDNEIKYKKCDNLDGPIYTISKSDVKGIQYANGTNETITESASGKIAPLMQNDYLNLALLRLLYAGLLYLGAFLLTLVAALLASAAIVFSIMFLILAYICIFIGALFTVAFMVYYICWLLKLVS